MGWSRHEVIVATTPWDARDKEAEVAQWRDRLPEFVRQLVAGPYRSPLNAYSTWLFLPDGATFPCDDSDQADFARDEFVELFGEVADDPEANWPRSEVARLVYGGDEVREHGAGLSTNHGSEFNWAPYHWDPR